MPKLGPSAKTITWPDLFLEGFSLQLFGAEFSFEDFSVAGLVVELLDLVHDQLGALLAGWKRKEKEEFVKMGGEM